MNKIVIAVIAVVVVVLAVVALDILIGKQILPTAQQGSAINLNLGTLYPNDTAIIETSKDIIVSKGGTYTFSLTNYKGVEKDFHYFTIAILFSNSKTKETIYLGWRSTQSHTTARLFLSPGKYNLTLGLTYYVNQSVAQVNFGDVVVKMGKNPLISVNFGIQTQPTTFQNLAFAKPICINLGKLSSESGGPFSNLSTIAIPSGGEYLFKMLHTTELGKDFESFGALITLYNSTENISIAVGFSYLPPSVLIYSNPVYLSPGVYKMNVSIFYSLNSSATPMSFTGPIIELDYTPLVNINFIVTNTSSPLSFPLQSSQPEVTQVGTGTIYKNGTAVVALHSTGSVEIEAASIVGTAYTASINSITPYQLTAGINTVTINFGSISLQPGSTYAIALYLSDGVVVQVAVIAE